MQKPAVKKIIVVMSILLLSLQVISPLNTSAASLNWDNPNSGRNAYKFKLSDYLNSRLMMQVVGCTGVVDKVAGTLIDLAKLDFDNIAYRWKSTKTKIKDATCLAIQIGAITGLSTIPTVDYEAGPEALAAYCAEKKVNATEVEKTLRDQEELTKTNKIREECLNGIAISLARNQLTAMTKATMNWVTTGFNGDPFYIRNINSFVKNISDEILNNELSMFKDGAGNWNTTDYPYGRSFSRSLINARETATDPLNSLKYDLTSYLEPGATTEDFSRDFSRGGWNAWLALTQRPQNNPLSFTMLASEAIAEKQAREVENAKEELANNDNFLSQKKCVVYSSTKKIGQVQIEKSKAAQEVERAEEERKEAQRAINAATNAEENFEAKGLLDDANVRVKEAYANAMALDATINDLQNDKDCAEWEVITPGSLIKDKVSKVLNSPETQLEVADTINDFLNILFSNLINKLRINGLSSLGSNNTEFTNVSGGFGSNSLVPLTSTIDVFGNETSSGGFDENRKFDLTKDLGNIYIHDDTTKLGGNAGWNAKTNTPELNIGIGEKNTYYVVSVAGNTKLFNDGYNVWGVGDRAFFDGENWQNWKKGETSPIAKRGIIQLQQDYVVTAKELLRNLPVVMPKLGELDYCIPGPNSNWNINTADSSEAFTKIMSAVKTNSSPGGFLNRPDSKIWTPFQDEKSDEYKDYKSIFDGTPALWSDITKGISGGIFEEEEGHGTKYNFYGLFTLSNWFSGRSTFTGKANMSKATEAIVYFQKQAFDYLTYFYKEYPKEINKLYGPIQEQFLETEDSPDLIENPKWLPVASDSLNLTSKMEFYEEEINYTEAEQRDAIKVANSNMYKLELIRKEVSQIVKAAQQRRMLKLNELGITIDSVCLEEEDINYLTDDEIILDLRGSQEERCNDGLDNDLDGWIDRDDRDCGGSNSEGNIGNTSGGGDSTGTDTNERGGDFERSESYY